MPDLPANARRFRLTIRATLLTSFAAMLLLSLLANVFLYRQSIETYRQLAEVQLDPLGLKSAKPQATSRPDGSTHPAASNTVLFFGDSRAKLWPAPKIDGLHTLNRGIAGQTTAQIKLRVDEHLVAHQPNVVVIQAGVNDLKAIGVLPDRRDEIIADCKANLRHIVAEASLTGAAVIVTTIFPPGDVPLQRRPVWSAEISRAVEDVNADLRTLASDRVKVLDAWKLLESGGSLREGLGEDTLHLNAAGYEALNTELDRLLRRE